MTLDAALQELVPGLITIYGDRVESVVLYGSYARGEETADSDVDIALILRDRGEPELHDRMLDLVVDLELACDKVLSVIRIDAPQFHEWLNVVPFYQNIQIRDEW